MHGAHQQQTRRRVVNLGEQLSIGGIERSAFVGIERLSHFRALRLAEAEFAGCAAILMNDRLAAILKARHQRYGDFSGAVGQHLLEDRSFHSSASSQICSLPPQARPTSQACSSVTPKSSSRALAPAITSCASRTTAPSMQPPETEPFMWPLSSTTSWLPTGRGEEPHVATTVATATPRPAFRHAAACSRMSSLSDCAVPAIG